MHVCAHIHVSLLEGQNCGISRNAVFTYNMSSLGLNDMIWLASNMQKYLLFLHNTAQFPFSVFLPAAVSMYVSGGICPAILVNLFSF